jgi:hypothetical protein
MLRGLQTRPLDLPLTDICIRPRFATTPLKLIKLRVFHSEIRQFRCATDVSLVRHPLSEVCPALTASTTMRMAWMTIGALSIMMLCPESVMCTAPGTSAASSFWPPALETPSFSGQGGGASGADHERGSKGCAGRETCPAQKALDQKNSTIKLPSIVPVNSINQSKGISPNGRSFWAKHAIITVVPHFPHLDNSGFLRRQL